MKKQRLNNTLLDKLPKARERALDQYEPHYSEYMKMLTDGTLLYHGDIAVTCALLEKQIEKQAVKIQRLRKKLRMKKGA